MIVQRCLTNLVCCVCSVPIIPVILAIEFVTLFNSAYVNLTLFVFSVFLVTECVTLLFNKLTDVMNCAMKVNHYANLSNKVMRNVEVFKYC